MKVGGRSSWIEATSSAPFVFQSDKNCHGVFKKKERAFLSPSGITGGTWSGRRDEPNLRPKITEYSERSPRDKLKGRRPGGRRSQRASLPGAPPPPAPLSNGNQAAVRHRPSVGLDAERAGLTVRLRCGAQL